MFNFSWKSRYFKQRDEHHKALLEQREQTNFWELKYLQMSKEVTNLNNALRRKNRVIKKLRKK